MSITFKLVSDNRRPTFLPKLFGRQMMRAEMFAYSIMGHLCPTYRGGFWDFYATSNGSGFMQWKTDQTLLDCQWFGNGWEGRTTPRAAGIIVTAHALSNYHPEALSRLQEAYFDGPLTKDELSAIIGALD